MAAKSDFAQKLLQDLRMRKERMAAATQNSTSSKPMSRGAHGNPGTAHRGSQKVTALESVGCRTGNSIRKTSAGSRSFHMEDTSNQIVLYGRGKSSEHSTGDLSTALAFAFGNGGKFGKMEVSGSNPMLNFLRHISRGSLDNGRMEIRSNMGKSSSKAQFPTYSHIHIHDISKGVQKLNQILRNCSNGVNFDRYSIELGKELLRGAMDLEESLRMLVNLQEASDYMVTPQRKNKIKLLEEDEDDQSETAKASDLRIVDRPKFSFDKPRNIYSNKEAAHNDVKQPLMAITYSQETPRLQEKQTRSRSNSFSQARSVSCVPNLQTLSTYLEPKDHSVSHSKPEKGRLSNVIAKLMGLEELPLKEESKKATAKELSSIKKETTVSMRSQIQVQPQNQGNGRPVTAHKNAISAIRTPTRDAGLMLEAESVRIISNGSSRVVVSDTPLQDFEVARRKDTGPSSKTSTINTGKLQNGISQSDQMPGYKAIPQEKEKAVSNKDDNKRKISMKVESKELLINDLQQQTEPERHILSKDEDASHEIMEVKRIGTETRNKNVQSLQTSKQQKEQDGHKLQPGKVLKKYDLLEPKRKQQLPKQRKQANESKGSQVESIVKSKPNSSAKSLQKKKQYDTLPTAAASKKKPMKFIDARPSKELSNSRIHETSVHLPPQRENANYVKTNKSRTDRGVDAAVNTRSGIPNDLARSLDHESPVLQEKKMQNNENLSSCNGVEQETSIHYEEAKLGIMGPNKPEMNTEPLEAECLLHNGVEEVTFSNSVEDECQNLEVSKSQPCNDSSNELVIDIHEVPEDQRHGHRSSTMHCDDLQLKYGKVLQNQHGGVSCIHEGRGGVHKLVKIERPATGAAELLTESEKHLKEKLIKGQLFLNTAEALFKLNIPVNILDGNDHSGQDAETKLILDCGYELLKKKGQRQEFSVYPIKEMCITHNKVRSFDDLVKQLSKDFNTLKSYGGNGSCHDESDTADQLHKMLENDFHKRQSCVNSMWDSGWNGKPFDFLQENYEIVKDVEKHMLNGLLDEITKDLFLMAIVSDLF